jgi:CheY-like chemotaxis protein
VVTHANHWPVLMDPAQVDQVVLNLAVNARDAMPDGGTLTIDVCDISADAAYCAGRLGLVPGDYVRLTLRDDGQGMDADTKARVFEPFFTTKAEDRGTGLGLASVYGIVKQNRGYIEVTSDVDRGTEIATYLPRSQAERAAVPAASAKPARGDETVLLVEDNDQVRHVTRRLLENLGYRVLAASGPAAALDVSDRCDDTIDLLLTDVVMPGMDGMELAQRIRARRPGVRTLCMSGYAPGNVLDGGNAATHAEQYLQKPFELRDLATAVRQALSTADAPPA